MICLKALTLLLVLGVFTGSTYSCQHIPPMAHFKDADFEGTYYWIVQNMAYPWQHQMHCDSTTITKKGKVWDFENFYLDDKGKPVKLHQSGPMDKTPGSWTFSVTDPAGKKIKYTMTVIAAQPKKWALLYVCDPSINGNPAFWVFYHQRVPALSIPDSVQASFIETLEKHKINTTLLEIIDQSHCPK